MKRTIVYLALSASAGAAHANAVNTQDSGVIAAFQSGLSVEDFESVATRTPQAISSYTQGDAVDSNAFVFDQIGGVQFSVGGAVGTNMPALYTLSGAIAGDAKSVSTVLGPVDFDFTTKFTSGAFIEVFFPVKVAKVGFWLNPSLGDVTLIAADTNFAFSGLPETTLESGTGTAGNFVGIERPTADIGGFKIIGLGNQAFSIDDFSFGTPAPVPVPASVWALTSGLAVLSMRRRRLAKSPG